MKKCEFPNGTIIKLDGVHELDPCRYEELQRFSNVTVSIRRCKYCGNIDIAWFKQEDTEEIEI